MTLFEDHICLCSNFCWNIFVRLYPSRPQYSFYLNIIQAKGSIIRAKHMDIDAHGSLAVFVGDEYSSHDRLIVMYFVHELINSSCQRDKWYLPCRMSGWQEDSKGLGEDHRGTCRSWLQNHNWWMESLSALGGERYWLDQYFVFQFFAMIVTLHFTPLSQWLGGTVVVSN